MAHSPEQPARPIRSAFADDPEMADLVEAFVGEMPQRLQALRDAWEQGEAERLRRVAHQLSGSCAGYGFPSVGRAARELERRLHALDAGAEEHLRELAAEYHTLMELCTRTCAQAQS
jgi:histidine phosphotransfer protein HptB